MHGILHRSKGICKLFALNDCRLSSCMADGLDMGVEGVQGQKKLVSKQTSHEGCAKTPAQDMIPKASPDTDGSVILSQDQLALCILR